MLNVKTSICCLGGIMQHPSAQAALESLGMGAHRGIFALPNSLPKWNQFMQSSDVIFLFPLRSCPSSSLKFFGLLVIKTSHLGWDMALKSSFPHHLRKSAQRGGNPCRALLYLYVDEPGGKFPKMLEILLNLPEGSAWLLC